MKQARPLGLTADGESILLVTEDGEQISVTADASLRAAFSMQRHRREGSEPAMSSQLSPREIQARIRAGESVDQVASAAGVPLERIEPFAGPVLAERAHVAGLALTSPVRRTGDATSHRELRAVIADFLRAQGIDERVIEWDSWRSMDRTWMVVGTFDNGSELRRAEFRYDQRGRYSVAMNEDAKWMIDELPPPVPKTAPPARVDPDTEPTVDFNDEFALVHAVGAEPTRRSSLDPELSFDPASEGDLTVTAGIYDIIPDQGSGLDTLYDLFEEPEQAPPMIGTPAQTWDDLEDYEQPEPPRHSPSPVEEEPTVAPPPQPTSLRRAPSPAPRPLRPRPAAPEPEPEPTVIVQERVEFIQQRTEVRVEVEPQIQPRPLRPAPPQTVDVVEDDVVESAPETPVVQTPAPVHKPKPAASRTRRVAPPAAKTPEVEPEAEAEAEEHTQVVSRRRRPTPPAQDKPAAAPQPAAPAEQADKPKRKKRRAAVPSWDEIMFGGSGD